MVGNEDAVHDTEAVIRFSLKCLKVGVGRRPGSHLAPPRPRPRQATCQRAPHLTLVQRRLQNPDVLPSQQPAPRSRCPPAHPAPRPLPPWQLAQPGRGPKRMPSADTRPHGLKGSQGKPDPPEAGEAVATHSTKCWHLHPYPGRQSADAAGGDLPFPPASWLGTFITPKDLVRGIKTFFSRYLIFCCCFLLRFFFSVCCTAV
uniref:Uncharacterized protein n=1 Tax=Myotis myotis TaxID=51298 RepID=A0A7J7S238_MYOMY|nr:hypothetical protein mMyoMyo1_010080 [Myotis myotis]